MKMILAILIIIVLLFGIRWICGSIRSNHTEIDLEQISSDKVTLKCAVFDGTQVWENSTVVIEDGVIMEETRLEAGESESEYFLMPGLIDAHAHLTTPNQMEQMVKNGVTTVCDVSASQELENSYEALSVWSSRTSIWLNVDDSEAFVKNTLAQGGRYIKVV